MNPHPTSPRSGARQDPMVFLCFVLLLFLFSWPGLLVGFLLWRFIHDRHRWLWLLLLTIACISTSLLWFVIHPLHQLQALEQTIDVHHPLLLLHSAIPFWIWTVALGPFFAGAIALFRPRSAKERLLAQGRRTAALRTRRSQQARTLVHKAPDATTEGHGVLGCVIEEH